MAAAMSVFANEFSCLALQGVVKENHNSSIGDLAFCRVHAAFGNLLADVGGTQANVYRLPAEGETVDLFFQFINEGPFPAPGTPVDLALHACAWLVLRDVDTADDSRSARDAWLAVAGADRTVHVLSLALGRELFQLSGHADAIVGLESCGGARELLVSLGESGAVRLWNVATRACVAEYATDATCVAFAPDGSRFYTGHTHGAVRTWRVPPAAVAVQSFTDADADACVALPRRVVSLRAARGALVVLDSRPALSLLVSDAAAYDAAASDAQWRERAPAVVARLVHRSWSVPAVTMRCGVDVAPDGVHVLLGDQSGNLTLYAADTGLPLASKKAQSRSIALKRALWSHDCRGVVCVGDAPFVWRWKYLHPSVRNDLAEEYRQTLALREIEEEVRAERQPRPAAAVAAVADDVANASTGAAAAAEATAEAVAAVVDDGVSSSVLGSAKRVKSKKKA